MVLAMCASEVGKCVECVLGYRLAVTGNLVSLLMTTMRSSGVYVTSSVLSSYLTYLICWLIALRLAFASCPGCHTQVSTHSVGAHLVDCMSESWKNGCCQSESDGLVRHGAEWRVCRCLFLYGIACWERCLSSGWESSSLMHHGFFS